MSLREVRRAAYIRGLYFDGRRRWLNNCVGYGYSINPYDGRPAMQADTLRGLYELIKQYPIISDKNTF